MGRIDLAINAVLLPCESIDDYRRALILTGLICGPGAACARPGHVAAGDARTVAERCQ